MSFPINFGSYKGKGQSQNQQYSVQLNINSLANKNISFETLYTLNTGEVKRWNIVFKETQEHQFQVLFNGFVVGNGLCDDNIKSCSYQIPYSKEKLEESFIIKNSKLWRYGSKFIGNNKVTWVEEYPLIPNRHLSF